jgi:ribose transport system permease protein
MLNNLILAKIKNIKWADFSTVIGLIALCAVWSILTPVFLTANNINNVIAQSCINGCVAIGMTLVIITGGIDLSVGSIVALSGVVLAKSLHGGLPIPVCMIIGLTVGVVCGLVNGFFITFGKLPPFIATLGIMSIARGLALLITDGRQISSFDSAFRFFGNGRPLGIPTQTIITVCFFILFYVISKTTRLGRYCYAMGGNEEAARLSGINITFNKTIYYAISGFMSAVAAIILTARLNSAQPIAGESYEMDAIAAAVIGGASLSGGEGNILLTLVGALIIGILRNGLTILNVSAYIQRVVIGSVIILAVLKDTIKKKI